MNGSRDKTLERVPRLDYLSFQGLQITPYARREYSQRQFVKK